MAMAHPEALNPDATTGGYDHDFVDPIEPFKCPMCLLVARDPVQTENCGHSYCQSCWDQHITLSPNPDRCPMDNEQVGRVFVDRSKRRMINDLKVFCDHKGTGCDQVKELRHLQEHMITCQHQLVTCDMLCCEKVLLWHLPAHQQEECARRQVTCPLCADEMLAQDMQHHESVCQEEEISCEWCHGECPRKVLSLHLSRCLESPTYCSFALHGCDEQVKRRMIREHHETNMYRHMDMLNVSVMGIHEEMGRGGGDKTATETTPHLQYELPAELWHRVEGNVTDVTVPWSELPGEVCELKAVREAPMCDRVGKLERISTRLTNRIVEANEKCRERIAEGNEMCVERIAEVDGKCGKRITEVDGKCGKQIAEVDGKCGKRIAEVDGKCGRRITEVDGKCGRRIAEVDGKCVERIAKVDEKAGKRIAELEKKNKDLSDQIESLVNQIKIMAINTKTKLPVVMKETDILKHDNYYILPIYWTFVWNKDEVTSPSFYSNTGYRMVLRMLRKRTGSMEIWGNIQSGVNDPALKWPWMEKLEMVVRDKVTGKVVQDDGGTRESYGDSDRKCPAPGERNDYVIWVILNKDLVQDNREVVVTLRRK